jgi:hypothetical protein
MLATWVSLLVQVTVVLALPLAVTVAVSVRGAPIEMVRSPPTIVTLVTVAGVGLEQAARLMTARA